MPLPSDSTQILADLVAAYNPATPEELAACERVALARASLARCAKLEAGFMDLFQEFCEDPDPVNPNRNLARGFSNVVNESKSFQTFLRMQDQARREYKRASEDLHKLISSRAASGFEQMLQAALIPPPAPAFKPPPSLPSRKPVVPVPPRTANSNAATRPPTQ